MVSLAFQIYKHGYLFASHLVYVSLFHHYKVRVPSAACKAHDQQPDDSLKWCRLTANASAPKCFGSIMPHNSVWFCGYCMQGPMVDVDSNCLFCCRRKDFYETVEIHYAPTSPAPPQLSRRVSQSRTGYRTVSNLSSCPNIKENSTRTPNVQRSGADLATKDNSTAIGSKGLLGKPSRKNNATRWSFAPAFPKIEPASPIFTTKFNRDGFITGGTLKHLSPVKSVRNNFLTLPSFENLDQSFQQNRQTTVKRSYLDVGRSVITFASSAIRKAFRPAIKAGYQRIEWTCVCYFECGAENSCANNLPNHSLVEKPCTAIS